jgi:hypothetical protein
MVYYLRPRNQRMQNNQHSLSYSLGNSEKQVVIPYLVILLLVTVISTLVILLGVKPDEDCFSFLCVKGDDGKCKVSNVRVLGLSLLIGLLVALGVFGVNKANPELLSL